MPPIVSLVLIAVFFVLFVLCVIADRHNGSRYIARFETDHPYVTSCGGMHISEKDELIWEVTTTRVPGFKVWKLSDVGQISLFTGEEKNTHYYAFRIKGRDGRLLGGKYYTASKLPVVQHAKRTFVLPDRESLEELADFVVTRGTDVEKVWESQKAMAGAEDGAEE
ncbi:MAG: hypothetical protein II483_06225 [Lachnospiraceae bacterium]|nr:hypothetical protein [Lachnospiraceae bacterium]